MATGFSIRDNAYPSEVFIVTVINTEIGCEILIQSKTREDLLCPQIMGEFGRDVDNQSVSETIVNKLTPNIPDKIINLICLTAITYRKMNRDNPIGHMLQHLASIN